MSINFDNYNNIVSMFFEKSKVMKTKPYLWKKNNNIFESLSWEDVESSLKSIARSLLDLGILKGDRVVILSENRPEWQIADLAIMSIGAITVPVYTTSTTADYSHVINHSGARCMIISSHELCLKALPALESSADCKNIIKINEAIILSMTKEERLDPKIINSSRKKRISGGSGADTATINKLLKQFKMMTNMMKKMSKGDQKAGIPPEIFNQLK